MEYDSEYRQSSELITTPFLHFRVNISGQPTVLQKMTCSPGFHLTTTDTLVLLENVPTAAMFYLQANLSNMCYHGLSTANWISPLRDLEEVMSVLQVPAALRQKI